MIGLEGDRNEVYNVNVQSSCDVYWQKRAEEVRHASQNADSVCPFLH